MTLLAGLSLAGGCFGSFRLVDLVYDFNRDVSDELIIQEVIFIAFAVVQVYSVSALADAIVFNTIEAITGDNPLAQAPPESRVAELPSGRTAAVYSDEQGLLVEIDGRRAKRLVKRGSVISILDGQETIAHIERVDGKTRVTDARGELIASDIELLWASLQH